MLKPVQFSTPLALAPSFQALKPYGAPQADVVMFTAKRQRDYSEVSNEKIEEYLEFLKSFPPKSQANFIDVFETQLAETKWGRLLHIPKAIANGLTDRQYSGKLNDIITSNLKLEDDKNPERSKEARINLASLGVAQLLYLDSIDRHDLVEKYIAYKASIDEHDVANHYKAYAPPSQAE